MKTLYYIIILFVVLSCGNRQEKPIGKLKNDSAKRLNNPIENLVDKAKYDRNKETQDDSITKHIADSLINVVKYIKRHENLTVNQRILRIKKLYESTGVGSLWNQGGLRDYDIDVYEIEANEIGLLLTDTNIIKYKIDSIFSVINKDIVVAHSEDNRLWSVSVPLNDGGTADASINIFSWRDSNNVPKGFITSDTEGFQSATQICADYIYDIYKLKSSLKKNLYLLIGFNRGEGNRAYVFELNSKGLVWDYKGFKTKDNGWNPINGKAVTYYIGSYYDDNANFNFDTVTQSLNFKRTIFDSAEFRIKGTLTFNGKYFDEKLSKSKMVQKKD